MTKNLTVVQLLLKKLNLVRIVAVAAVVTTVAAAVDTAAVCINAQAGVERVTQQVMAAAAERGLCRMLIVNRIDAAAADLSVLMDDIQANFGAECLPINLPAATGDSVVDCFFEQSDKLTAFSSVREAHTAIVDQVVELDEALMQVYLEQGDELTQAQLHAPFEQALREGHLVPVCFVSARTGAGLSELLDIFARLMPNPLEGNGPEFLRGEGAAAKPVTVLPDPSLPVIAHVFKISIDPYLGRMGIFRIHQGRVTTQSQLFVGDGRKPFKVAHLMKLQGKQHTDIREAVPGDLCALVKVDELAFDAVLHNSHAEDHYHLRPLALPPPMYGLAIAPARRGEEQKLADALSKITAADPSLRLERRASLNETVLFGCGELHLRVVLEQIQTHYHVALDTQPPSIAYRETVTRKAAGHYRHKKQSGGAGQFGEVSLLVEPLARGAGFEFVSQVVGGAIPAQFIPAVEKGVRSVLVQGALAGYPLQDLRVLVTDGKHHAVDSKEVAFVAAGKRAFLDAIGKAEPIILEPIVNITIAALSHQVGDISGDLAARRGLIKGTEVLPQNRVEISAQAPQAELNAYESRLKSLTGGAGSYALELSHYAAVPIKTQTQLAAEYRAGPGAG